MINSKRLYKKAIARGISHDEMKANLCATYNVTTTKDLTREQFDALITWLNTLPHVEGHLPAKVRAPKPVIVIPKRKKKYRIQKTGVTP
jgi:hypothetical protein